MDQCKLRWRPNGSRVSCGASAGGRKRPVLRDLVAGAETPDSPEGRPRQLQALVRPQLKDALFLRTRDLHGGDAPTLSVLNPDVENPGSASVSDLAQCPAYENVAVVRDPLLLRRRRGHGLLSLELGQPLTSSRSRMASRSSDGTCAAIALGTRHDNAKASRSMRALDMMSSSRMLRPNGSRLSCGRSARGRKELEPQTKRLASEATQFLPTCERPAASSAC